jgi:2-amino-4-hydroxy-6-hydroxymethyldihydropteridine diphosphokinase
MVQDMKNAFNNVFIGLGGNFNNTLEKFSMALNALQHIAYLHAVSPLYQSKPLYYEDQEDFLNAVAHVNTSLEPLAFLDVLQNLETTLGRVRSFPNAPRAIDLDILWYDDTQLAHPRLTLPHPLVYERAFVLYPMVDIAPTFVDVTTNKTMTCLKERLPFPPPLVKSPLEMSLRDCIMS